MTQWCPQMWWTVLPKQSGNGGVVVKCKCTFCTFLFAAVLGNFNCYKLLVLFTAAITGK